jgi:hypothetical protein
VSPNGQGFNLDVEKKSCFLNGAIAMALFNESRAIASRGHDLTEQLGGSFNVNHVVLILKLAFDQQKPATSPIPVVEIGRDDDISYAALIFR